MDLKRLNQKPVAVIAAITAEHGMLTWMSFEFSVDIPKFLNFLNHLLKVCKGRKICVFMDNLYVHRSQRAKDFMRSHDIEWMFNVPYCPETNPIECVFSLVKKKFKEIKTS
jgi:hypothetical protein